MTSSDFPDDAGDAEGRSKKVAYVGVTDYRDGSGSFDWSVSDPAQYQAVVDARNALNPVTQAFLVPSTYEETHYVNWSEISVVDLDRAGCGTSILYPRHPAPAEEKGCGRKP
jgi:hypothetical protein